MAAVENNRPDPMKAFKAIAMILNAREEGVKVRLTSVRKVEEDVRKAGQKKSLPVCLTAPEGYTMASRQC